MRGLQRVAPISATIAGAAPPPPPSPWLQPQRRVN